MEENVHLILEHVIRVGVTGVLVVVEEYGVWARTPANPEEEMKPFVELTQDWLRTLLTHQHTEHAKEIADAYTKERSDEAKTCAGCGERAAKAMKELVEAIINQAVHAEGILMVDVDDIKAIALTKGIKLD